MGICEASQTGNFATLLCSRIFLPSLPTCIIIACGCSHFNVFCRSTRYRIIYLFRGTKKRKQIFLTFERLRFFLWRHLLIPFPLFFPFASFMRYFASTQCRYCVARRKQKLDCNWPTSPFLNQSEKSLHQFIAHEFIFPC